MGPEETEKKEETTRARKDVLDWLKSKGFYDQADAIESCGETYAKFGDMEHSYVAQCMCGREFCPVCGEKGSPTHERRKDRIADRLEWAPALGYVVFTLPLQVRGEIRGKEEIDKLHEGVARIVESIFGDRGGTGGLTALHFFGDENPGKLAIHVNVLFPLTDGTRWTYDPIVPDDALRKMHEGWKEFLREEFGYTGVVEFPHYSYASGVDEKANKIRYVARPTVGVKNFLKVKDSEKRFLLSLAGVHNFRWWGSLSNSKHRKYLEDHPAFSFFQAHKVKGEPGLFSRKVCKECGGEFVEHRVECDCHGRLARRKKCPVCGKLYPETQRRCSAGELERVKKCPECGRGYPGRRKKCECGEKLVFVQRCVSCGKEFDLGQKRCETCCDHHLVRVKVCVDCGKGYPDSPVKCGCGGRMVRPCPVCGERIGRFVAFGRGDVAEESDESVWVVEVDGIQCYVKISKRFPVYADLRTYQALVAMGKIQDVDRSGPGPPGDVSNIISSFA